MRTFFLILALLVGSANCADHALKILEGARKQVQERTAYVPGYVKIAYPNGDVPRHTGVCTDVVIRSLRHAGFDLQKLIHEDMKRAFNVYPKNWGLTKPDSNIDHRRVPNQMTFFRRHGQELPITVSRGATEWKPGDIVYWKLDNGLDHCGIVADRKNAHGVPLVIHNIGECSEEDCLTKWKIIGHFRYPTAE